MSSQLWGINTPLRQHYKVSIELHVATRYCRNMTEKLLKATLNPNKQQQILSNDFHRTPWFRWVMSYGTSTFKELMSNTSFSCVIFVTTFEPPHDKTSKMTLRPAKTQISLGIRPVWSESSLCALCVAKGPGFLHADSEDSDRTGRIPRLIWVFAGRTCHFVGFVVRRLILSFLCFLSTILNFGYFIH